MKNKLLSSLLAVCLLFVGAFGAFYAFADPVTWAYNDNTKTLVISGSGDMENYADGYSAPWHKYINSIKKVVIEEGITSIGAYSLAGAQNLTDVDIADSVTSVNDFAFSSCAALESLTLGSNVTYIADSSMAYNGITPKLNFKLNVTAGSYSLFYAVKNSISFNCKSVKCGSYTAQIVSKGTKVYYPYTARVSGKFRFYSTGAHDTYGYLYDENFKQLKSNDDASSSNTNFSLTYDLEKGKTYYFAGNILNTTLTGSFGINIEAVDYTVTGTVYAMGDKNGAPSTVILENATINGAKTDNGKFSYSAVSNAEEVTFECDGKKKVVTITPDNGDVLEVVISMCDVNNDGIVNGKDFAIMRRSGSKYLDLFAAFADYKE